MVAPSGPSLPQRVSTLAPEIDDLEYNQDTDVPNPYTNTPMDYYSRWYSPTAPDHATADFNADRNRNGPDSVLMVEHCYTNDHITGPLYTGNIPTGGDPLSSTQSLLNYAAA